jgi:tetratricopeptide (TPR) repeat protein
MKADHRKQLEKNELADRLARWWKGGSDQAKSNSTFWGILGAAVLVVVLIFAWRYYAVSGQNSQGLVWAQIDAEAEKGNFDQTSKGLEAIVEANHGTSVGRAAKAQLARLSFNDGINRLCNDQTRSQAIANVEKARTLYGELVKESNDDPELQREAMLSVAQTEESLVGIPKAEGNESRGSLDKALELYDEAVHKYESTPEGKQAAARAKDIRENKEKVQQFYDELGKRYGKPETPTTPRGDLPGSPGPLGLPSYGPDTPGPSNPLAPPPGEPAPKESSTPQTKPLAPPPDEKSKETKSTEKKPEATLAPPPAPTDKSKQTPKAEPPKSDKPEKPKGT